MGYWDDAEEQTKIRFSGKVTSVQVRSDVWRYLVDNRTHRETGYNLFLTGYVHYLDEEYSDLDFDEPGDFSVAVSEKQMQSLKARIGDEIEGTAWTEKYPEWEYADFYRAGALKAVRRAPAEEDDVTLPSLGKVPSLETYAWRGARMLDAKCYKGKCFRCRWAAMANVTIEYDWGRLQKHRYESFCYGPKSCRLYKMGRPRAVPYKGMGSAMDEGWLDDICTERRGDDD